MRRIFGSRKRGPASCSPACLWGTCAGSGCAGGDKVPRYLRGYCAVGQVHRAASVGAAATVERFLTFRVNGVNDTDKRNRTALHYACAHGHLGVVTLLVERNCDINARDDDNCTPLIKASQRHHEECVALLLRHGADPNTVDTLGNTALHYAVLGENTFIASRLLEHSANIEAKTKDGLTPLLLALRQKKDRIAEFLIEKGASIHTVFPRDRPCYKSGSDGPSCTAEDGSNIDTKDEADLKIGLPRQKASQTRKTRPPPYHLQKTPARSGAPPLKTDEEAQESKRLSKVLKNKLKTFPEPFEKGPPPPGISKGKAHLKVREERERRPRAPGAAPNDTDRSSCAVASAAAAAAASSASASAVSASTSASCASAVASAAFASASAAATSASVASASASAAAATAASASASASDAVAAATAASASASDASAAAASSRATVAAAVTAAVAAALAATAGRRGAEPTPPGRGANTDSPGLAVKEEEDRDKKSVATPTSETHSLDTSGTQQGKDGCVCELRQDERRSEKSTSVEKHEVPYGNDEKHGLVAGALSMTTAGGAVENPAASIAEAVVQELSGHLTPHTLSAIPAAEPSTVRKQTNALEGLDDRTLPPEAASDDGIDSGCQLGPWDELYLCKRLLEAEDSCGGVLAREIVTRETKDVGVHKELSNVTKALSQLEQREAEWEELCNLRSSLKQECEKRDKGDFLYGKTKADLRGGERQYHEELGRQLCSALYHQCYNEELEVSEREMFLALLNMNVEPVKNSVTQLQEAQLQEDPQREVSLSSLRMEHQLQKLEVDCLKLEGSVKNQAEEIEEIRDQLLREDSTGDAKKQLDKLTQPTQSLALAVEQEKEKTEELEKELHGFMEVLQVTGKKLNECENRGLYFHENMKNRAFEMLKHEINYLKETWEPIHCKYLHQDISIQLAEQELLKIKTDQRGCENLHKTQETEEKEVLTLKSLIQESATHAEEERKLGKLRENSSGSRMSQMILRIQSLESKLPEVKSRVDCTRKEMEKCKQLYGEESKSRRMTERLAASQTKLARLNQQKTTLETVLSSLPVQKCPRAAKRNPATRHNSGFPPRDASLPLSSEAQPVREGTRKGLPKKQMGPEKHMPAEAEVSVPVDPRLFEASPSRPKVISSHNL